MCTETELFYQIALTLVPGIGPVQAKILLQHCEPEEIFHAKKKFLDKIEGIGTARVDAIRSFNDFKTVEEEIAFIKKQDISPLFLTDKKYPRRLLNCYDSPTLLYYKGEADLNTERMIAVIGTRKNSDYGRQMTDKLIHDLSAHRVSVISGLAFGIDALAHRAALKYQLTTVAVVAHGLDQVYPPQHASLAKEIINNNGGLLTEFRSCSKPDKHNFPSRNRIVAGMTNATIVIETDIKGGSMITADLANSYNRDVFAIPGRNSDPKSAGANLLIQQNRAILLTDAQQLLDTLGWSAKKEQDKPKKQRELFIELSAEEKVIVNILSEKESVPIDELNALSGLSSSMVASAVLNLELQNVIVSLPGKIFRLN